MGECNADGDSPTLEVRLFAGIRDAVGSDAVRVPLSGVDTVARLKEALLREIAPEMAPLVRASRIAVGNAFATDEDRLESALRAGTTIALIPPVSGG